MIKQSRIKEYFSDIICAIGFLISVFGMLRDNSLITAFGIGIIFGGVGGIINNIWIIKRHTQELKNIDNWIRKLIILVEEGKK